MPARTDGNGAISDVIEKSGFSNKEETVYSESLERLLKYVPEGKHRAEMRLRKLNSRKYYLTFRVLPYFNEENDPEIFVTIPEAGYCGMLAEVKVMAQNVEAFAADISKPVVFDSLSGDDFMLYGERVATIRGEFAFHLSQI